jgi:uncharacterized protein YndB with AHSA1/START domain
MTNPDFVYTTYIKTTPEKLWNAITNPEFTRQYWGGHENVSDWKKGSPWKLVRGDDKRAIAWQGKVLESAPFKRLSFSWADSSGKGPESRVTFEIEPFNDTLRLSVIHDKLTPEVATQISGGWPLVLASMKSFLETGKALDIMGIKSCGASKEAAA